MKSIVSLLLLSAVTAQATAPDHTKTLALPLCKDGTELDAAKTAGDKATCRAGLCTETDTKVCPTKGQVTSKCDDKDALWTGTNAN